MSEAKLSAETLFNAYERRRSECQVEPPCEWEHLAQWARDMWENIARDLACPFHVGQRVRITGSADDGGFHYIKDCYADVLSVGRFPAIDIDVDGHGKFSSPARWLTAIDSPARQCAFGKNALRYCPNDAIEGTAWCEDHKAKPPAATPPPERFDDA